MAQYCITGKKIIKPHIPETYDINKIQLGIVARIDYNEKWRQQVAKVFKMLEIEKVNN